jgi:hypothetical protein
MSFCMDIFKSTCCDNYTCGECCTDFLNKRDNKISTMHELLAGAPYKDTACPHCNTLNFHPTLVIKTDTVRDYLYNTSGGALPLHSPLKIGDSFEVMKSKMEKLNTSPNTITEEGVESPNKNLFPDSARGTNTCTPRGIAITSGPGLEVHRAAASSFVHGIFSSQEQEQGQGRRPEQDRDQECNSNSVSDVAAAFVHNIFYSKGQGTSEGRRQSKHKVTPLNFNDDGFDNVSVDGSNSHRDMSSRQQVLAQ